MAKFTLFDAFAGIGGIRLGFEAAGKALGAEVECVGTAEIDQPARQVYKARFNHGDKHRMHSDVRNVTRDTQPEFDIFVGGFPCQAFSMAGKREGFLDQVKGTLYFECLRLIDSFRPAGFLLENVEGLTNHDGGRTFATIVWTLAQLRDYVVEWQLVSSRYLLPQDRKRIYIVGYRPAAGGCSAPVFPLGLSEVETFRLRLRQEAMARPRQAGGLADSQGANLGVVPFDASNEGFFGSRHIRTVREPAATLVTSQGTGFIQRGKARWATEVERERLMGFPDGWCNVAGNSKGNKIKQTGNAVVIPMIQLIAEKLLKNIEAKV